jgi:N-acyl-phosphatidylethanolamine-hydrolysing phospholipase D
LLFKKYKNPHIKSEKRGLLHYLLWVCGFYNEVKRGGPPEDFSYPNPRIVADKEKPRVTWVNHCTFLVQVEGINVLTDPMFSKRCSPVPFFGPKRQHDPAVRLDELPPIDLVLISHNHYDHLDKRSVRALNLLFPKIIWAVPTGVKGWFTKEGIESVIELDWWKSCQISLGINRDIVLSISSVPAQHYSGRGIFDKNESCWTGWVVRFDKGRDVLKQLYFVGDTGYNRHDFNEIGEAFGGFDLSLIPIGTYVPGRFMDPVHISPEKAALIHREVGSKLSVGMHWKTFRLSDEPLERPPYDLYQALEKQGIDHEDFRIVNPGQVLNW